MSEFLTSLANQLQEQYGSGQTNALNIVQYGHNRNNQKLGDYAKQFDQTEGRKYVEEGYLRLDAFNVVPKAFEVLLQEPEITVLVKKRAFSTLAENHRPDYMDADEKLFYKASKILFQNKCRQIAALEKLSKIERVSAAAGQLDIHLIPIIIGLVDQVNPSFTNSPLAGETDFLDSQASAPFKNLVSVIDKIRKVWSFSVPSMFTSWITDTTLPFQTDLAQGTGVIEITNLVTMNITSSLQLAGGSLSFSLTDPYKAMTVTNTDIEWALLDAINVFNNSPIVQLGKASLDKIAAQNSQLLNDARAARGAGPIEFQINPIASVDNQVAGIFSSIGEMVHFNYSLLPNLNNLTAGNVHVASDSLRGGPIVGQEGLDPNTEVPLFAAAVSAIYNSIQVKQTAQNTITQSSKITNYARKKLRFHYAKKPIIQIMDQVHIYINSKSQLDKKILSGLQNMFNGLGFLQKVNKQIFDLKNQASTLFNPSANIDLQLEKAVYVGSNFPTALWVMMRGLFINDKSGTHVFAGIVESSNRQFSDGKWTVNVACKDNAAYLTYSVVNLNPGVDQFNGPLHDPLTPFQTDFDAVSSNFSHEVPTLLPENQELLNSQLATKGMAKFNSGRNAGAPVTLNNFFGDKEFTGNGISRNVYYAPNGFVYKWKEGIGVLVQFGDSFNNDHLQTIGLPSITQNPLAGQDVMNVLSLYVTGVPYNYVTYYNAASKLDTFGRHPQSGQSGATSFYAALTNDLKKRNLQWGDFIPFKNLVVDDQTYMKMLDTTLTINNTNTQIDQILQQIQDVQNKINSLQKGGDTTSSAVQQLKTQLATLTSQLSTQTKSIQDALQNSNNQIHIIGSDVSYDPSQLQDSQSFSLSDPKTRRELRRTTNFLTRRMAWQVRANEDKNLFIVDDSYDKDYDITAFEIAIQSQLNQYSSEYSTVSDKITSVANLLNLEVFCDTQGHIRARAPQYNRMPSSVFYRMIQLKQQTGIQFFPQFLEDLFTNNLQTALAGLKIVEDQIRLDGAILGKKDDAAVTNLLSSQSSSGQTFKFVTNDDDSPIMDFAQIISQDSPDTAPSNQNTSFVDTLNAQNAVTSVFTVQDRAQIVQDAGTANSAITTVLTSDRINDLKQRLFKETGQQVVLDNFTSTSINSVLASPNHAVDVFKITKDLADKLQARQKLIKQAAGAIKNAKELKSLDSDNNNAANQLLFPNLYGNSDVPEIFEHMIEDETYDDYGIGSGGRYIIHNYQILSLDIEEQPPAYTTIEVSGQLDPLISNSSLPAGLNNSFPGGGNGLITAAAVDYDLWRMYGWRTTNAVQVPFLSNPQTQCAPYAASLLSRARRTIFQGSVVIAGNEYMQPGEVVYIEDEDLLFYVASVSHDLTYGHSFTTRLQLTYGHNPGEYIPTSLDVIGKMVYNTTANVNSNYANYRQSNVFNESSLGSLVINSGQSDMTGITGGNYGNFNNKVISNIMYVASSAVVQNNILGSNVQPSVEIRIYYDKSAGAVNSDLQTQANNLQSILTGTADIDTKSPNTKLDSHLPKQNVNVVTIDISDTGEHRSPTQSAWDLARNAANTTTTGGDATTNTARAQQTMFKLILDCVMVFNYVASTTTPDSTATSTTTQTAPTSSTNNTVASNLQSNGSNNSGAGF